MWLYLANPTSHAGGAIDCSRNYRICVLMKPSPFDYYAPKTIGEAVGLLNGDDAMVLAGGQSLVPAMNLRLASPTALVDINRISGFDRVTRRDDGVELGMLVRHADLESPPFDDALARLLGRVARYVGHLPIRVRGTFVGSLAHADPAAEWCAVAAALDAVVVAASHRGEREIAASEFFAGPFTTALEHNEIATAVRFPLLGRAGVGFSEVSRTAGDFATVAAVAALWTEGESIARARIALAGVGGVPVRAHRAEEILAGSDATETSLDAAAEAAAEGLDPVSEPYCSADFRRHLARVMVARSLRSALEDAT